jgi:hypothetical protein
VDRNDARGKLEAVKKVCLPPPAEWLSASPAAGNGVSKADDSASTDVDDGSDGDSTTSGADEPDIGSLLPFTIPALKMKVWCELTPSQIETSALKHDAQPVTVKSVLEILFNRHLKTIIY